MNQPQKPGVPASAQLGLGDAVSIIIGIVVGVSIFKVPSMVFNNVETVWGGLGVWALGGLLSLIGALCYAELATTYPRSGGDYVYLVTGLRLLGGFLVRLGPTGGHFDGQHGCDGVCLRRVCGACAWHR